MAAAFSTRSFVMVVAAVVVAGLGYWVYGAYQQRQLRTAVGTVLNDAGARLREALSVEAGPAPEARSSFAQKLEGHAAAVDEAMTRLKRLPAERNRRLTDDADGYLVTVREIFRKQASLHRSYDLQAQSLRTLSDHMRADNRTGDWVGRAVVAKEKAERDFRDYRLAATSYVVLLEGFPAAEKKIEPVLGREALAPPEQLTRVRARVLAGVKSAEADIEKARRLVGPR